MKLGIVSDIHCNVDALRLALERMGPVDELLCAGDAFYEYRFSNEVIELLREREVRYVLGNHETTLLSPAGVRARNADSVRKDNLDWVASRPLTIEVNIAGRRLVMVHASPLEPHTQYVWPGSPELRRLSEIEADYIVLGHTHRQMAEHAGRALVINPGSAGEARDPHNGRRFSYAILDTSSAEVLFDNFTLADGPIPEFVSPTKMTG